MARMAEHLMDRGGTILAMIYYGAKKVVDHYNIMSPVKAALEAIIRTLAFELGSKHIRVNCISPGPLQTSTRQNIASFPS
jgi:enoyl-[acyl-carrier protein] reductase I